MHTLTYAVTVEWEGEAHETRVTVTVDNVPPQCNEEGMIRTALYEQRGVDVSDPRYKIVGFEPVAPWSASLDPDKFYFFPSPTEVNLTVDEMWSLMSTGKATIIRGDKQYEIDYTRPSEPIPCGRIIAVEYNATVAGIMYDLGYDVACKHLAVAVRGDVALCAFHWLNDGNDPHPDGNDGRIV